MKTHFVRAAMGLSALLATALSATPAHALPIWAEAVAQSYCEYLVLGAESKQAISQAYKDNLLWKQEILEAGDLGSKAIVGAIRLRCNDLSNRMIRQGGN